MKINELGEDDGNTLFIDLLNDEVSSRLLSSLRIRYPWMRKIGEMAPPDKIIELLKEIQEDLREIFVREVEPSEWAVDLEEWVRENLIPQVEVDGHFKMRLSIDFSISNEHPDLQFRRFVAAEIFLICSKKTVYHIGVCEWAGCRRYFIAQRLKTKRFCSDKCRRSHHRDARKMERDLK